jgi:hypothetical protein
LKLVAEIRQRYMLVDMKPPKADFPVVVAAKSAYIAVLGLKQTPR